LTGYKFSGQKAMEVFCPIARDGIKSPQFVYFAREIADFLLQFAARRVNGRFTRVNAASRYFQKEFAHRVAELANQKDISLFVKSHYSYAIAVLHHFPGSFSAASFLHSVPTYVYHSPVINLFSS
jgi:hypothetical protein